MQKLYAVVDVVYKQFAIFMGEIEMKIKKSVLNVFTVLLLCACSVCLLSCKKEKCYYMIQGCICEPDTWWQSDIDVEKITSVSFLKNYTETGKELEKWHVGKTENDKIFCYVIPNGEFYSLIIASNLPPAQPVA